MFEQADLLRLIEGDCSPEEAAAIQAWIAGDPKRGELWDELRAVWRITGDTTRDWGIPESLRRLEHTKLSLELVAPSGRWWTASWATRRLPALVFPPRRCAARVHHGPRPVVLIDVA